MQGEQPGASLFRTFIEENLPALGVAREEIPFLARCAAKTREVQLRRDRLIADAGPLLGAALDFLLDDNFGTRDEPVQKLLGADAVAKGKAFSHLLDLIVTPGGYDNLQALARRDGFFSHELVPTARWTPRLGRLAIKMFKGKMELADSDRDHARLIFLLTCEEHGDNDNGPLILKRLLKTAQAHPGGQTAQALKKLIVHPDYLVWAADVREVLPDGAPVGRERSGED